MLCSWRLPSLGKGKTMNCMAAMATGDVKHYWYDKLLKRSNNFFMNQISCDLFQFQLADDAHHGKERYCDVSRVKGIYRCSGGELLL